MFFNHKVAQPSEEVIRTILLLFLSWRKKGLLSLMTCCWYSDCLSPVRSEYCHLPF